MNDFWTIWVLDLGGYWAQTAEAFDTRQAAEAAFDSDYRGRPRQLRSPEDKVRRESAS